MRKFLKNPLLFDDLFGGRGNRDGGMRLAIANNGDGTAAWSITGYEHPDSGGRIAVFCGVEIDTELYTSPTTAYDATSGSITINDPSSPMYFTYVAYDESDGILQVLRAGPLTITGYTDVAAFLDALETEGRTVTTLEREAMYDDKTRGLSAGHYTKLYDRVWFGWANANANRVRQKALTKIAAFTAPVSHNAGHIDCAGGGYGKVWSPADAFSSVNSIGNLIGTVGTRAVTGGSTTIDMGVRNAANTNNCDLFYGYGFSVASFGNNGTARMQAATSSMAEGFYLASRVSSSAGRLRTYIAATLATPASRSDLSGGALSTHPMAIGGYALDSSSVDNNTGHKYSQVASYDGLTNTEADDALIDALTTEIALGWRSAP